MSNSSMVTTAAACCAGAAVASSAVPVAGAAGVISPVIGAVTTFGSFAASSAALPVLIPLALIGGAVYLSAKAIDKS